MSLPTDNPLLSPTDATSGGAGEQHEPAVMIVMLALLDDIPILAIAYDKMRLSSTLGLWDYAVKTRERGANVAVVAFDKQLQRVEGLIGLLDSHVRDVVVPNFIDQFVPGCQSYSGPMPNWKTPW